MEYSLLMTYDLAVCQTKGQMMLCLLGEGCKIVEYCIVVLEYCRKAKKLYMVCQGKC